MKRIKTMVSLALTALFCFLATSVVFASNASPVISNEDAEITDQKIKLVNSYINSAQEEYGLTLGISDLALIEKYSLQELKSVLDNTLATYLAQDRIEAEIHNKIVNGVFDDLDQTLDTAATNFILESTGQRLTNTSKIQTYVDFINDKYGLGFTIPEDPSIYDIDPSTFVNEFNELVRDVVNNYIRADIMNQAWAIGDMSVFETIHAENLNARSSHIWEKTADNEKNVSMTIYYDIYTNPSRFKSVNKCVSKGINGYIFDAAVLHSTTFSNNYRTAKVSHSGMLFKMVAGLKWPVPPGSIVPYAIYSY